VGAPVNVLEAICIIIIVISVIGGLVGAWFALFK
jgi:hypothetical protein